MWLFFYNTTVPYLIKNPFCFIVYLSLFKYFDLCCILSYFEWLLSLRSRGRCSVDWELWVLNNGCTSAFRHRFLLRFIGIVLAWTRIFVCLEYILASEVYFLQAVAEWLLSIIHTSIWIVLLFLNSKVCQLLLIWNGHKFGTGLD